MYNMQVVIYQNLLFKIIVQFGYKYCKKHIDHWSCILMI